MTGEPIPPRRRFSVQEKPSVRLLGTPLGGSSVLHQSSSVQTGGVGLVDAHIGSALRSSDGSRVKWFFRRAFALSNQF
ncbi:uncharacterized protein N7511_006895 [Penicillium nucicola]|uniref:uncharacterized protein n=1 Tax=Penicillium nucicola TaxID=1850975 RepID=UPI002544DF20|nr:uncharacterized protein N7511_006895 [Penicillium nucicola]KAJ5758201.1 hypothetical protein N7511_006895 [Penicillium nucicola]